VGLASAVLTNTTTRNLCDAQVMARTPPIAAARTVLLGSLRVPTQTPRRCFRTITNRGCAWLTSHSDIHRDESLYRPGKPFVIAFLTESHSQHPCRYVEALKDRIRKLEGILSEVSYRSWIRVPAHDAPDTRTTTASCFPTRKFGLQISLPKPCDEASYCQGP
jgi:hypothetical protein